MKKLIVLMCLFFFVCMIYGQNVFRIAEDVDLTLLVTVDSIVDNENEKLAYLTEIGTGQKKILRFNTFHDSFGYKIKEYQVEGKDTILVFANLLTDTLENSFAMNEYPKLVYRSLLAFNERREIEDDEERLAAFIEWFVSTSTNKGIKPCLSTVMREDKWRDHFFSMIRLEETQFVFDKEQKKIMTENINNSRCLSFEDFYLVYLLRYSYDEEFEESLKRIMRNYCLPFGDSHFHMMKTILYNKQSEKLEEIHSVFRRRFFEWDIEGPKAIFKDFIDNM